MLRCELVKDTVKVVGFRKWNIQPDPRPTPYGSVLGAKTLNRVLNSIDCQKPILCIRYLNTHQVT
jgi:hypothetical protein